MPFTFSIPSSMVGLRTEVVTAYCPSERENQRWGRRLVGIIMSWSSPSETDRALTVTITHLFHGVFWPSPSISLPTHNRSQYTCRCVTTLFSPCHYTLAHYINHAFITHTIQPKRPHHSSVKEKCWLRGATVTTVNTQTHLLFHSWLTQARSVKQPLAWPKPFRITGISSIDDRWVE